MINPYAPRYHATIFYAVYRLLAIFLLNKHDER